MRDAFFDRLYELALSDRRIMVVAADMGAPSLDKFRRDLAQQFINIGIAEEAMVTVAVGLALSGKKVYTYAIMPFATLRCFEALKVNVSLMNVPVTIVGVGAGFSYDDSGPTHHATEDLSVMRVLPNFVIYNPSDSFLAARCADMSYNLSVPCYVRLDRKVLPTVRTKAFDIAAGYRIISSAKDGYLLATGNMVHQAVKIAGILSKKSIDVGVIDIFRIKPINEEILVDISSKVAWLATLEEHLLAGGFGSSVAEVLVDRRISTPLKRIGLAEKYYYEYGGRGYIRSVCHLTPEIVAMEIRKWLRD